MQLRQLLPGPANVSIEQAAAELRFADRAPADRPFVAVNMISSADGKATILGRTAAMSSEADRELFHELRAQVDGILVGAGTVRIERYGPVTKSEDLRAKRARYGQRPQALAVIASATLNLPADIPLLADPESEVVVVTTSGETLDEPGASLTYLRLTLAEALGELRQQGVRTLLCEGGPTLNSTLFEERLVDELFLTLAPEVAGSGEALTIVEGMPLLSAVQLDLLTAYEAEGQLFLRYRVR